MNIMNILIILLIIFTIVIIILFIRHLIKLFKEIDAFNKLIEKESKNYIPFSKYIELDSNYDELYNKTKNLSFFRKIYDFNVFYCSLEDNIKNLNEQYINNEINKHNNFFNTIFKYPLDEDQKRAIITDDDYNLIIAGAGSGKTSTMVAKIKYLLEIKKIPIEEILIISFSNNTVDSFIQKLADVGIKYANCLTFHKLGKNSVLKYNDKIADSLLDTTISEYLNKDIIEDEEKLKRIIEIFSYYIHFPPKIDFETLGDQYEYEHGYDLETIKNKYVNYINRNNEHWTLQNEKVRSYEELVIANYLFLNGIEYEYEKKYSDDLQYNPDFYLKKYDIYLEHFGINKNGKAPQFSKKDEEKYLDSINWKRNLHKERNTKLIETYSYYFKNETIIEKLEETLKNAGVEVKQIDLKTIHEAMFVYNQSTEYTSFIELTKKFINMFKGNNFDVSKIKEFIKDSEEKKNIRNQFLLNIFNDIYIKYETKLSELGQMDFDDLINKATEYVNNNGYEYPLKYIIVDEFQDTSHSRFGLIKAIIDKTHAKLITVGDDWQSIYRFSGCDLDLFVRFSKYVEHPQNIFIKNTHRNSQELINLAGSFIMKNKKGQIKKDLKSSLSDTKPVRIYYYENDAKGAIKQAVKYLNSIGCKDIAILGRNYSDIKYITDNPHHKNTDLSEFFNGIKVNYYTVHKSKGLEFDGVIIANMSNYIAGFPNKMADDPVLNYVTASQDEYLYEEERRLFYVALTRTKTKCCIIAPTIGQSMFISEILDDKPNDIDIIIHDGDLNLNNPNCPICKKGKLAIRTNRTNNNKFVGCMNYPQCDYTSKYLEIIDSKIKCPNCEHFIVKKTGKYGEFYGCTNYPACKQTYSIENKINDIIYDDEII